MIKYSTTKSSLALAYSTDSRTPDSALSSHPFDPGLSDEIRKFGPKLEEWFRKEAQSQQGQAQGEQQSTGSALAQRTKNMVEYSKFAEMHIQQAQTALDSRNYGLAQKEHDKALQCVQEVSMQIEYSRQLLRQEMERGHQEHQGRQHGNILNPELEAAFDTGEHKNFTYKEKLERVKAELYASKNNSSGKERNQQEHHNRDGRDR